MPSRMARKPLPTPSEVAKNNVRISNRDNSVSTERSVTFQTPRGFVNAPSLYKGTQLNPQEVMALSSRGILPSSRPFRTRLRAERAAKARSNAIVRVLGNSVMRKFQR